MQSASDTPLSHLWALSCPADQRGVGRGSDRRAHPGGKAVAERSHFGDLDVPKCITSTATLRFHVCEYLAPAAKVCAPEDPNA